MVSIGAEVLVRSSWLLLSSAVLAVSLGLGAGEGRAIALEPLTATGTYQRPAGPPAFRIGRGGAIEEIEAFLAGPGDALAAQLSAQSPPAGLSLAFSSLLSADATDLHLFYDVTNTSLVAMPGAITFISFVDAEIDETLNTFFNEFGESAGALAPGQSYEIDEPGFSFGDIFQNARAASLDDTNGVPESAPEDVSMALAFAILNLAPGQTARFELMLSEDGDSLGGLVLRQRDADPRSTTGITFSGAASIVPEPGTAALLALGAAALVLRRRRA